MGGSERACSTQTYDCGVPKRTNLFQEVVEIIHRHMAEGATVESPAMMPSRSTGSPREVDVVIRANQAGHEVVVSIEAMARSRRADRKWVDEMVGKHADLPTSKLILVSEKGFTKDARAAALAKYAVPLAPEDVAGEDPARDIVAAVPALWPKIVSFTPETFGVKFAEPAPDEGWGEQPIVGIEDGRVLGELKNIVRQVYKDNLLQLGDELGFATIDKDAVREVTFRLEPEEGDALQLRVEGVAQTLYLVNDDGRGYALRWVTVTGSCKIEVSEKVPLKTGRLGDVNVTFGYGEGKVGGREALLVLTEKDEGGGALTIRVRPDTETRGQRSDAS